MGPQAEGAEELGREPRISGSSHTSRPGSPPRGLRRTRRRAEAGGGTDTSGARATRQRAMPPRGPLLRKPTAAEPSPGRRRARRAGRLVRGARADGDHAEGGDALLDAVDHLVLPAGEEHALGGADAARPCPCPGGVGVSEGRISVGGGWVVGAGEGRFVRRTRTSCCRRCSSRRRRRAQAPGAPARGVGRESLHVSRARSRAGGSAGLPARCNAGAVPVPLAKHESKGDASPHPQASARNCAPGRRCGRTPPR